MRKGSRQPCLHEGQDLRAHMSHTRRSTPPVGLLSSSISAKQSSDFFLQFRPSEGQSQQERQESMERPLFPAAPTTERPQREVPVNHGDATSREKGALLEMHDVAPVLCVVAELGRINSNDEPARCKAA